MKIDNVTRLRRLRKVLLTLEQIDPDASDLSTQVTILKQRAALALQETKLAPGNPLLAEARKKAYLSHKRLGKMTADRVLPIIKELKAAGFHTYQSLADELNRRKIRPPMAKQWRGSAVFAIEKRSRK